jgi:hypothetical protein
VQAILRQGPLALLKRLYIILEMAQIGPASLAMENASSAEVDGNGNCTAAQIAAEAMQLPPSPYSKQLDDALHALRVTEVSLDRAKAVDHRDPGRSIAIFDRGVVPQLAHVLGHASRVRQMAGEEQRALARAQLPTVVVADCQLV